jgi:hypothetical protein
MSNDWPKNLAVPYMSGLVFFKTREMPYREGISHRKPMYEIRVEG